MSSKTVVKGPYQDKEGMWCIEATTTSVSTVIYRCEDKEQAERCAAAYSEDNSSAKEQ